MKIINTLRFVVTAGLLTGISLTGCQAPAEKTASDETILQVGDDIAIAQTQYGKVQGFILNGIYQYRGIPYGANTTGKNRFMPPQAPEAWDDVYKALWWGNTAPQIMENRYANAMGAFTDHWNYDDVSEDCLKLNVWTPGIEDGKNRPVLVWLHGGGYTNGNGMEQDSYNGENLSRKGDVVFVSINHRLGPIGFSDLSGVGGDKYKHSGNVGALDMVAALKWVNQNIQHFGGDPNNVTIMGQSGGGAKTCILTAMPAASGLFHKAVPLSGSTTEAKDQAQSQSLGEYILAEAGLKASEIDKLQEMPWREYYDLANRANVKYMQENNAGASFRGGFAPVADGINIPKGKFYSDAQGVSSQVPMLISSTFHEWAMTRYMPELEKIDKAGAIAMLAQRAGFRGGLGDKAEAVYEGYEQAFPEARPIDLVTLISSSRKGVVETATLKSNQEAPVYVAWFGWEPPMFDKRMGAFHCLDISFWFANTDEMYTHTGGGARPRALADKMSDALLQFMRTGNPNVESLPEWPVFTPEKGEVMILNDESYAAEDPDRVGRELL